MRVKPPVAPILPFSISAPVLLNLLQRPFDLLTKSISRLSLASPSNELGGMQHPIPTLPDNQQNRSDIYYHMIRHHQPFQKADGGKRILFAEPNRQTNHKRCLRGRNRTGQPYQCDVVLLAVTQASNSMSERRNHDKCRRPVKDPTDRTYRRTGRCCTLPISVHYPICLRRHPKCDRATGNHDRSSNLGTSGQTVTVKAFAGGNIRTANNVFVPATQTVNLILDLQGNGANPNPCLALNSAPPGGGKAPVPPVGTGQSNIDRERMRAAIQKANFFANELYPIFSHPRCLHCHGGVIPGVATTRVNHQNTNGAACTTCHGGLTSTQQQEWRVVSSARFVNLGQPDASRNATITVKPWTEVCNLVRTFFPNDQALVSHVQGDPLIGWAFSPGTAPQRAPAGAAPGTQANLTTKIQQWIAFGKPCGLQPAPVGPGMFR